jgi:poly-gamma-glutamate capsule biosynthesis protein CapA/YwtB (metallophosphatase superfamily)
MPESNSNTEKKEVPKTEIIQKQEKKKVSIIAIGDIMFHMPQIKSAYSEKKYDFRPFFEHVKSEIESADIAIGNLETTINPRKEISSYPRFNSPVEVLDAIKYTGFDVLVTANNHSVDTGRDGIISTVNMVNKYGMVPVGTGMKTDKKYSIVERNGVKIGILAYTSSTNGIKPPEGMINLTDINNIQKDISEVKKASDFVIVYVHTGTEYVRKIEAEQQKLFRKIADVGADCVLGSHPHVVRPSEIYNSNGRKVYINYSMGNFISNQTQKYTDIGTMVKLSISKEENKSYLEEVELVPVYRLKQVKGNKRIYRVLTSDKIEDYSLDSKSKTYIKEAFDEITQQFNSEVFNTIK